MDPNQNISFIPRLYAMVNDKSIPQIYWSKSGEFFVIPSPEEFAQVVLPAQFKHNNFASFVRQLNMYGFHKVADLNQLANSGDPRAWAFEHSGFVRGKPELLQNIHRKPKSSQKKQQLLLQQQQQQQRSASPAPAQFVPTQEQKLKAHLVIDEIKSTKQEQARLQQQFKRVNEEREVLWREYALTQKRLHEQEAVTRQVLEFLKATAQQKTLPFSLPELTSALSSSMPARLIEFSANSEEVEDEGMVSMAGSRPASRAASPKPEAMDLDAGEPLETGRFFVEDADQGISRQSSRSSADLGSLFPLPPTGQQDQDFLQNIYQFEDSYLTPYCSMEEDAIKYGLNAPLNWVPS